MNSYTSVVIPFDERVIFINLLELSQILQSAFRSRPDLRRDLRDSNLGQGRKGRQAVASSHGLNQAAPRGVTTAVGEHYAVWVSAYCSYEAYPRISSREPRSALRFNSSATPLQNGRGENGLADPNCSVLKIDANGRRRTRVGFCMRSSFAGRKLIVENNTEK